MLKAHLILQMGQRKPFIHVWKAQKYCASFYVKKHELEHHEDEGELLGGHETENHLSYLAIGPIEKLRKFQKCVMIQWS